MDMGRGAIAFLQVFNKRRGGVQVMLVFKPKLYPHTFSSKHVLHMASNREILEKRRLSLLMALNASCFNLLNSH